MPDDPSPPEEQAAEGAAEAPEPDDAPSRWERRVVAGAVAVAALLLGGGGAGLAWLAQDPAWAQAAQETWRIRGSVVATPQAHDFRARYAQELLQLAARSPEPLRTYLDWRAEANCATVRADTPPGTFASCRQLHLDRLLYRGDGPGLLAAAEHELDGAPPHWVAPLHRYAARGGVLAGEWELAREHTVTAFSVEGGARDALRAGWLSLKAGQQAVALNWLDRAFTANGGYPSPQRAVLAMTPMRQAERDRYLAAIDAEAAFYDACRASALATLDGETVEIPDPPFPF